MKLERAMLHREWLIGFIGAVTAVYATHTSGDPDDLCDTIALDGARELRLPWSNFDDVIRATKRVSEWASEKLELIQIGDE